MSFINFKGRRSLISQPRLHLPLKTAESLDKFLQKTRKKPQKDAKNLLRLRKKSMISNASELFHRNNGCLKVVKLFFPAQNVILYVNSLCTITRAVPAKESFPLNLVPRRLSTNAPIEKTWPGDSSTAALHSQIISNAPKIKLVSCRRNLLKFRGCLTGVLSRSLTLLVVLVRDLDVREMWGAKGKEKEPRT
jgi:hypothetical protein